MKYGDTLRQRSIAAWQTHNIDYQDIKHFIKLNTTPGNGKAVSIPGAADSDAADFENSLFEILREQDERITWFVRSKVGEIQRRLAHLQDQVERFVVRISHARATYKRQERYGRVETDILKVGEEIQALSRFIGVQQEAFRKLIKKYKKWTGSSELAYRFNVQVRQRHGDSFVHTDLKPFLELYEELLHTIRLLSQNKDSDRTAASQLWLSRSPPTPAPSLREASFICENGKRIDFDKLLATVPFGEDGKQASYWVHPENVVEVQILLQQYTRSFNALCRRPSMLSISSNSASPSRTRALSEDTFDIIVDDANGYLINHPPDHLPLGSRPQKAALHARGVSDEDTALFTWEQDPASSSAEIGSCAAKRKCLRSVLTPGLSVVARKASLPQLHVNGTAQDPAESLQELQDWLKQHDNVSPIASIFSQRSRFFNVSTNTSGVVLAALDMNILIQTGLAMQSDASAIHFPYAVLTVRQEGTPINQLIPALDESHLIQRIHDFSLEYHAVYQIQQPSDIEAPYWMPLLNRDLRKMPQAPSKPKRSISNEYGSQSTTPRGSTATSSNPDAQADLSKTEHMRRLKEATLAHESRRKVSSKRRRTDRQPQPEERYWNEYDDPSDDEDNYVIYMDPNYESFWDKTWRSFRKAFGGKEEKRNPETEALLYSPDLESGGSMEDVESSDDEAAHTAPQNNRASMLTIRPDSFHASLMKPDTLSPIPRLTLTCFASSIAILVVACILAATGKRKLHAEVDAGVIFAVATSLTFAITGLGNLYRSNEVKSPMVWVLAGAALCCVAAANGGLLAWMLV